jgi:peptide/nickel transport system substrate-binding protein
MTIGLGLAPGGSAGAGVPSVVRNISAEGLVAFLPDARPDGRLAASWNESADGLAWTIALHPGVTFHDGSPVTASTVRDILIRDLPNYMGPAFGDVKEINASNDLQLEFRMKRRSTFLLESLDSSIQMGGDPPVGTGPFYAKEPLKGKTEVELFPHERHYGGKPRIDRLHVRGYTSIRSAWADMLRGRVDMLYEISVDATDLLKGSTQVQVFFFPRPYAYAAILNVRRPPLRDPAVRRALNAAIDRARIVHDALGGHGAPADGPLLPSHWAYDTTAPKFEYDPKLLRGLTFKCLYVERSHERLALVLQQQLQEAGVQVVLENAPVDEGTNRIYGGDFDAALVDVANGPLVRSYLFWHSEGPNNWGHFASPAVDDALGAIQHAPDESAYRSAVARFQRAMVDDPPAIFLAWSERARAVSTKFDVPAEPGRDILSTLRWWRPAADKRIDNPN